MAYGLKYRTAQITPEFAPFMEETINIQYCFLDIYEKDYAGIVTLLKTSFDSVKLIRRFQDLEQHILGSSLEFEVRDESETEEDYFILDDLMTATERQFFVRLQAYVNAVPDIVLFEGFINTENSQRKYLHYNSLGLICSSYLNKLQHFTPVLLDVSSNQTFIDLVLGMLEDIGSTANVRINSLLMPEEDNGLQLPVEGSSGYTLYNKVAAFTELFWENNIERKTAYNVLIEILKITNAYIYWWNGYWYIERYNNIWNTSGTKNFVQYDLGTSYGPTDNGVDRLESTEILDLHTDLVFTEMTKTRKTSPGCKLVTIKLNEKQGNLIPSVFSPMVVVTDTEPSLDLRQWVRFHPIADNPYWDNVDVPFKDIENGIRQTVDDVDAYESSYYPYNGLYVDTIITCQENSELVIKWKFNLADSWVQNGDSVPLNHYYLIKIFNADGAGTDGYLKYSDSDGWYLNLFPYLPPFDDELFIRTTQGQFDQETKTIELSVTIPLYDINKNKNTWLPITLPLSGNFRIQFTIGHVRRKINQIYRVLPECWYGDVEMQITGNTPPNNYWEGAINTDFLNRKSITIDLADISDYTYLNGIVRGDDLLQRTALWQTSVSGTPRPIVDHLMIDKFRFYNVTRLIITGNVIDFRFLRPLSQFIDSKQGNKKFVLFGYEYKPSTAAYDVYLLEYDNTTEVTLIDA